MKKSFLTIVQEQRQTTPPVLRTNLAGQTVLVIGANTGIGFEAAKHFGSMNPGRLILACRDPVKGKAAVSRMQQETGYTKGELWIIDLASFSSVMAFADKFERDGGRLDILVANAGVELSTYTVTPDGWESTLQVNHLATSLVSLLLLPRMQETARRFATVPRLVVVSSDVHYLATFPPGSLEAPKALEKFSDRAFCTPSVMGGRYMLSKLLNIFFVRAFNDRLSPAMQAVNPVTIVAVSPGFCASELGRHSGWMGGFFRMLFEGALAHTSEEGSRYLVHAALGGQEDESKMRGAFVLWGNITEVADSVLGEEGRKTQDRMWEETIDILEKLSPKVQQVLQSSFV